MSRYHTILGVPANATTDEIKAAYRRLAKRYHPDINNSSDAHEKFVLITEAYEMLLNSKQLSNINIARSRDELRRQARARAAAAARMKYEAFTQTTYYRNTVALSMLIDLFGFAFIAYLLVWFNVAPIIYNKPIYLLLSIPALAAAWYGLRKFMKNKQVTMSDYADAVRIVLSIPTTQIAILGLLNSIVLLTIGMQTLAPLLLLFFIYLLGGLTGHYASKFFKYKYKVLCYSAVPSLVSVLLAINLLFAHTSYEVTYKINREATGSRATLLQLEDDALIAFPHCRFFFSYTQTANKTYVRYRMAHGALGIMVIKNRKLI